MASDVTDDAHENIDNVDRMRYVHRQRNESSPVDVDRSFDWRGWVLVGSIIVSFLIVPGALLILPAVQGLVASIGFSLRDAYLTLPLIPAFLLGAVSVWSAIHARSE